MASVHLFGEVTGYPEGFSLCARGYYNGRISSPEGMYVLSVSD